VEDDVVGMVAPNRHVWRETLCARVRLLRRDRRMLADARIMCRCILLRVSRVRDHIPPSVCWSYLGRSLFSTAPEPQISQMDGESAGLRMNCSAGVLEKHPFLRACLPTFSRFSALSHFRPPSVLVSLATSDALDHLDKP
jgi:hypothetical protein